MGAPPVTNVLEKARRQLSKKSVAVSAAILALLVATAVFMGPRLLAEHRCRNFLFAISPASFQQEGQKVLIESGGLSVSMADRGKSSSGCRTDWSVPTTSSASRPPAPKSISRSPASTPPISPSIWADHPGFGRAGDARDPDRFQADLPLAPDCAKILPNRFDDVAGQDEAKAELQEVIAFLKDSEAFTRVGARILAAC